MTLKIFNQLLNQLYTVVLLALINNNWLIYKYEKVNFILSILMSYILVLSFQIARKNTLDKRIKGKV